MQPFTFMKRPIQGLERQLQGTQESGMAHTEIPSQM